LTPELVVDKLGFGDVECLRKTNGLGEEEVQPRVRSVDIWA
jgi:hypothetical protein